MSVVAAFPGWQEKAACRSADPDLFFGPDDEPAHLTEIRERIAREYCDNCPVRDACHADAESHSTKWGVWGAEGELDRQRRRRRERERKQAG